MCPCRPRMLVSMLAGGLNTLPPHPILRQVVTVRPKMDRFIFTVETNGSMRAEDVVTKALEVLRGKLMQLRNELVAVKQDAASY
jgi:hypothetical protein